ncbi:DUF1648 domain-containing protein [Microbacterium sp. LB16]|uniref:DUF1648 domain-containing protein n=1 Tax=Microbacterium sp. LB16 TaxID=3081271 RepID=UPI00301C5B6B
MTTHDLTRTPPALLRRARLTFFVVAVIVPILITAVGVVVLLSWLPTLPAQVATHWGVGGADAFGPPATYLWLLIGIGLGLPLLMAITTLAAVGAHWGGAARLMGALAAGMAAFAAVMSLGSLAIQRDLTDPADVPGIGGLIALGFAALLVIGALAWLVQPRVRPEPGRTLEPRHAVHVAQGERVVWVSTVTMPRGALAFLFLVLLGLVALAVYMLGTGVEGGWIVAIVVAVVAFALAATASFRVRVTPEGFAARALLGWPRIRIPLDEIASARAVEISPFGEFGGWGWRIAGGVRTGIRMRPGPAIEISPPDPRPVLVTLAGAEEAAAPVEAYAGPAHAAGPAARGPRTGNS